MRQTPWFAATALLACLTGPGAHAATYNAAADFSTTSNSSSSLWSYRTSASLVHDGNYTLLPNFGPFAGFSGDPALTAGWAVSGVPAIGLNRSGADQYFTGFGPGAQFTWPAATLFMHPGTANLVVVSWLSPQAAVLNIDFRVYDMDGNLSFGDGVAWWVEKNSGASALASGAFANGLDSGKRSVAGITVAAGDRINFIVGPNGDYQGDSTRLDATITATPVPELPSVLLMLAGTAALVGVRRRR